MSSNKVIINLRKDTRLTDFSDKDILMYDATKKEFYKTTPETFFDEYNKRLKALTTRYDKRVETLEKEFEEFTSKIKETNSKLIDMVEKFIKGE